MTARKRHTALNKRHSLRLLSSITLVNFSNLFSNYFTILIVTLIYSFYKNMLHSAEFLKQGTFF